MSIWFHKGLTVEQFQYLGENTLGEHLGMQFTEIGDDFIRGTMPVDHRSLMVYCMVALQWLWQKPWAV
jgi:1,4-dihydroxy-2-naphthoyl-CoA hydrolase